MRRYFTQVLLRTALCCIAAWPARADTINADLDTLTTIPIERFTADGKTLLLWLPSEFDMQPAHATVGKALATRGVEVWIADLFGAVDWQDAVGKIGVLIAEP